MQKNHTEKGELGSERDDFAPIRSTPPSLELVRKRGGLLGVAADTLSILGVPTATLSAAIDALYDRRLNTATGILLEEIRRGTRSIEECSDEEAGTLVAGVHRFYRAATEGAARVNLRLLARVMTAQFEAEGLYPDVFLRYADLLSSLSREEAILLGVWHRHWVSEIVLAAEEGDRSSTAMRNVRAEVVPALFANEDAFLATAASLTRTGLLLPMSGWGMLVYRPSPLLRIVTELADFEGCVQREDKAQ